MKALKYSTDITGSIVLTDGKIYVGFACNTIDEVNLEHPFDQYSPYTQEEVELLGINTITNWENLECTE